MRHSIHAFAIAVLLLIPNALSAEEAKAGSISVENAWSRATPAGAQVGAGYLTIKNYGSSSRPADGGERRNRGTEEIHQLAWRAAG